PTDVEGLFDARVKPPVKVECTGTTDAPVHLGRKLIPTSLLQLPTPDGKTRLHEGPLYFSVSGSGTGHVLDLTDQPGQAGQITHFAGETIMPVPYPPLLRHPPPPPPPTSPTP